MFEERRPRPPLSFLAMTLGELAEVLLDGDTSAADLERAAADLHDCLSAPVALPETPSSALPTGTALAPSLAAACTKDAVRTAMFLRGVDAALTDALARFGSVDALYAGTGPLAPLVIPLLPRYLDRPVRFTFLDVHEESVRAAGAVAGRFGVSSAIRDFVTADATTYVHPRPLHLVVMETMQRALTREPHVAIARQLAPQLAAGGILVPESVRVDLVAGEFARTLLDVRAGIGELLPVRARLPASGLPMYVTTITTYGDHAIEPNESGLTQPELAFDLVPLMGSELEFRYRIGPDPRFVWRRC